MRAEAHRADLKEGVIFLPDVGWIYTLHQDFSGRAAGREGTFLLEIQ